MNNKLKKKGRLLTFALRHKPEEIGIVLDPAGWTNIEKLLIALDLRTSELETIVENDNKCRFSFSTDGLMMRASQGHSVKVDLGLDPIEPPESLYHGTVKKFLPLIKIEGLKKMSRHQVHLSTNLETARQVASRRNTDNVLLEIRAKEMHNDGHIFYRSDNGVWLTDNVPYKYIHVFDR